MGKQTRRKLLLLYFVNTMMGVRIKLFKGLLSMDKVNLFNSTRDLAG